MINSFTHTIVGFFTGIIDSVVGGGGLISLPYLSFVLEPGPHAIGTNKIVGTIGSLVAFIVYASKGHLKFKEGILFSLLCAGGSFLGSESAPYVPRAIFQILLIIACPLILYFIFKKDDLLKENIHIEINKTLLFCAAIFSGFYDGFFGPGGGTVMFLSLFFIAKFPLLNAIAISKMANLFSASTALITYHKNNFVHYPVGLWVGLGTTMGTFIGAHYASKNMQKILRPMLVFVTVLLSVKILFDLFE